MIGAMPRPRKPHLHRERNRHGTHVWYVRKGQGPRFRLRSEFGSEAFNAEYEAAIQGRRLGVKDTSGALVWLWGE